MTTYHVPPEVGLAGTLLFYIVVFPMLLLVGLIGYGASVRFVLESLGTTPEAHGRVVVPGAMAFLGLLAIFLVSPYLREVRRIRIAPDGFVQFVRVMGTTRIPVHCIRRFEGRLKTDYDGNKQWYLRVRYSGGHLGRRIDLPRFHGLSDFVAAVQILHPDVDIAGLWPMTWPPDSQAVVRSPP